MTRFLCTGDLHLGAGAGLGREPGDRLRDQRHVLNRIVDLADDHRVDAILFAGDAFEGPTVTPEQYAVFQDAFRDFDRPVLAITGNGRHDCAMRDVTAPQVVADVAHVHNRPDLELVGDTAVCCLPWAPVARLVAARDGGDRDEAHDDAARLVLRIATGLREDATRLGAERAVLMLHWSISGAALPNGLPVDDLREPVLPLEELELLGFDAIVAGHIHKPQLLSPGPLVEDDLGSHIVGAVCPIFYVGSPLPLNFGETSTSHGVWLLDFDRDLDTSVGATVDFLPVESRPLVTHDLDLTTHDGIFNLAKLPSVDGAIVRVRYKATAEQARRFDHSEWVRELSDAGAHHVASILAEIVRENRARVDGVDETLAPREALDLWIGAEGIDDWQAESMRELLTRYHQAVAS